MKKPYSKPEIRAISIRPEERLAACDYYYKSSQSFSGCNSKFFPVDSPATCTLEITPESIS